MIGWLDVQYLFLSIGINTVFLKSEEDKSYQFMRGIVEPVRLAVSELSPQEHRIVELHYFQCYPLFVTVKKLAYSVMYIQTLKTRCLFDLNCVCASVIMKPALGARWIHRKDWKI